MKIKVKTVAEASILKGRLSERNAIHSMLEEVAKTGDLIEHNIFQEGENTHAFYKISEDKVVHIVGCSGGDRFPESAAFLIERLMAPGVVDDMVISELCYPGARDGVGILVNYEDGFYLNPERLKTPLMTYFPEWGRGRKTKWLKN